MFKQKKSTAIMLEARKDVLSGKAMNPIPILFIAAIICDLFYIGKGGNRGNYTKIVKEKAFSPFIIFNESFIYSDLVQRVFSYLARLLFS